MKTILEKSEHNTYEESKKMRFFTTRKLIIIILALIFVLMGIAFAYIKISTDAPAINTIKTKNGIVSFNYNENSSAINISRAYPIKDATGKKMMAAGEYFDFNIKGSINSGKINYKIVANKGNTSVINNDYIKIYLTEINNGNEKTVLEPILFSKLVKYSENNEWIILDKTVSGAFNTNYRLRIWLDENASIYDNTGDTIIDIMGQDFEIKLNVYANQI